jgi:hypothetical protein
MSYETNPYYHPEALGLEPVAEIEYSDLDYQFDTRVVWRLKTDPSVLYSARDSGCSCPSPFEDYNSLEDLERLDAGALANEVAKELRSSYSHITAAEASAFLQQVEDAVV